MFVTTEIAAVVAQATGLSFEAYLPDKRSLKHVHARLLFVYLCKEKGLTRKEIALLLHRSPRSITRLIATCRSEIKYNAPFRKLLSKVKNKVA